jgi:hypothetical protein
MLNQGRFEEKFKIQHPTRKENSKLNVQGRFKIQHPTSGSWCCVRMRTFFPDFGDFCGPKPLERVGTIHGHDLTELKQGVNERGEIEHRIKH